MEKTGRIVAIDHGTKRIGVALSDKKRIFAFPGKVVKDDRELFDYLREIDTVDRIATIVVGLPLNMDDTEGERAKDVRSFCQRLKGVFDIEIVLRDERLTSFEAENMLQGVRKRGIEGKKQVDLVAAQIILRTYLASL